MEFIHNRNIKDCTCLAFEATNILPNKAYSKNIFMNK